jgi:hypothetical protein
VAFQGRYRLIMRQPLVRIRFLNAILTNRFLLLKREPSKMRSFLTAFDKTPINQLFMKIKNKNQDPPISNQLNFFD